MVGAGQADQKFTLNRSLYCTNKEDHVTMLNNICLLSFDIEDWFNSDNFKNIIRRSDWDNLSFHVIETTKILLDILEEHNIKATFFILGWIANRSKYLVRIIYEKGHEIASHGYDHQLIYQLNFKQLKNDFRLSKMILEDIIGEEVFGYRAPSFSITDEAIIALKEEGYHYDSSFFDVTYHDRYGKVTINKNNYFRNIIKLDGDFYEVPISNLKLLGIKIPWGGGGYFRLIPYWLFEMGVKIKLKKDNIFVFYLHPWELDEHIPFINLKNPILHIRQYYGIKRTKKKFERFINKFKFLPIKEYLKKIK